jgi:hypothetical protein
VGPYGNSVITSVLDDSVQPHATTAMTSEGKTTVINWRSKIIYIYRRGQLSRYSDSLQAGRSGDRIPVETRFSAPIQTGPGDHTASYTMDTRSFPGLSRPRRGTDHPSHLAPRLKKTYSSIYIYIQGVPGGMCETSGGCSLC